MMFRMSTDMALLLWAAATTAIATANSASAASRQQQRRRRQRRRRLDQNMVSNNGVLYTGSIQPTVCLSYTILLGEEVEEEGNDNDTTSMDDENQQDDTTTTTNNNNIEAQPSAVNANNDESVDVMVAGQESFVYFEYLLDTGEESNATAAAGDVVSAQNWCMATTTGSSSACIRMSDPSAVFTEQVLHTMWLAPWDGKLRCIII